MAQLTCPRFLTYSIASKTYHYLLGQIVVSLHNKTFCFVYTRLMLCIYTYAVHLQPLFAAYALIWKETLLT